MKNGWNNRIWMFCIDLHVIFHQDWNIFSTKTHQFMSKQFLKSNIISHVCGKYNLLCLCDQFAQWTILSICSLHIKTQRCTCSCEYSAIHLIQFNSKFISSWSMGQKQTKLYTMYHTQKITILNDKKNVIYIFITKSEYTWKTKSPSVFHLNNIHL